MPEALALKAPPPAVMAGEAPAVASALERLHRLHPKLIDLSLARVERLLAELGHPERKLPPVVHVAGTNGKGSTLATLDAMLVASGATVHRYVSPHLVRFNERILLHGRPIEDGPLAELLEECERVNGGDPITFFEITTAAAFLAYSRAPADWLLLETGMGGRLDATNVVARPRLTLITPVSMDHEAYLGDTLAKIAAEKAGILKANVPAILGPQEPEALDVLLAKAEEVGAPVLAHGRDWRAEAAGDGLKLDRRGRSLELPVSKLPGVHQRANAGLAAAAGLELGLGVEALAHGLRSVKWPARLQRLTGGRLSSSVPEGVELWLDGGHNPAAGVALANSLPKLARGRPVHLVIGMLASKDAAGYLEPLAGPGGLVTAVTAVPIEHEATARPPEEIASIATSVGLSANAAPSLTAALNEAGRGLAASGGLILLAGSLYLAGQVLSREGA